MNILFFLTPKSEVAYVDENDSLRQVLEKMEHHGYAAVPLLSSGGKYIGTITEGDVLWKLKKEGFPELHEMEDISVMEMIRNRDNKPVHINVDMEGLMERIMKQNFVPVVDDDKVFIGIVTRKDAIQYLIDELKKRKYDGTAADKINDRLAVAVAAHAVQRQVRKLFFQPLCIALAVAEMEHGVRLLLPDGTHHAERSAVRIGKNKDRRGKSPLHCS